MTSPAYQTSAPQTVSGTVEAVNPKGCKINGEWLNWSKWAEDPTPPERGQVVTVTLDKAGFVRGVEASGGGEAPVQGRQASNDLREVRIIRQSVLRTAGEFCASRPELRSADLIALAERLEAWVLRGEE